MDCIFCGTKNSQVENSRETQGGSAIWRRRKCSACGKIFSTYERVGLDFLIVEKRGGKHARYLSQKLFASIYDAVSSGRHVDRGDASTLAHDVVRDIELQILQSELKIIKTRQLIDMTTDALEVRDLGACYRYAASAPYRGMKFGI